MPCIYQIVTAPQPRILARVLQLFDQQQIIVQSLVFNQSDDRIQIRISAAIESALARRLQAKLLHLLAIEEVQLKISESRDDSAPAQASA